MSVSSVLSAVKAWAIRTWEDRAKVRRNLIVAIAHITAVIAAFQFAFPNLPEQGTIALATATRFLTSFSVFLASAAVGKIVGGVQARKSGQ
ncbi:hypothetical protein MSP7336_01786 [Mycobacterium shimoidei]|uniref:Uncharacterized protein n=1 Tax=Mycobacterium shimoidei TaxID=29313 RepID=A0A375YXD8_MYCSH|nr:hypothetical protein [Mycobacterium shimoidei]SRX93548.1 hypothetical protein MSP7336_01786 [Mycobacterium shimoidei]